MTCVKESSNITWHMIRPYDGSNQNIASVYTRESYDSISSEEVPKYLQQPKRNATCARLQKDKKRTNVKSVKQTIIKWIFSVWPGVHEKLKLKLDPGSPYPWNPCPYCLFSSLSSSILNGVSQMQCNGQPNATRCNRMPNARNQESSGLSQGKPWDSETCATASI